MDGRFVGCLQLNALPHQWGIPRSQVQMAYPIESKLVVGITSTALFDFSVEHQIFEQEGVEAFRSYQEANRGKRPQPGTAFPFIKRLLNLNRIFPGERPWNEMLMISPLLRARIAGTTAFMHLTAPKKLVFMTACMLAMVSSSIVSIE